MPFSRTAAEETAPAPAASASSSMASGLALLQQLDEGFTAIFQKVAPAVVVIETEKKNDGERGEMEGLDFFFRRQQGADPVPFPVPRSPDHSEGSGFIIRPDGYILTNNHVVEEADKITVRLKDGRRFTAKIVGSDEKTDIAVIRVDAKDLPTAELGDSDRIRIGQLVFAIGIPYNLDYSFSGGWVSAKGRSNLLQSTDPRVLYEDYIQTDAFINPGNSGGPLFDINGRVIGMNSFINGIGRGLSFAIPSNMLRTVSDQLIAGGKVVRPWLGIRMLSDSQALESDYLRTGDSGVVVRTILPDAPAYKSDLRPADIITHVDGTRIATTSDLQKAILRHAVGDTVRLTVLRNGESLEVPVTTGELPADPMEIARRTMPSVEPGAEPEAPPSSEAKEPAARPLHGLQLQDLDPQLAERLDLRTKTGVLVTAVQSDSIAAHADIRREDVITEVDSQPVTTAAEAQKLINGHDAGKGILLFIDRRGQKTYAVLDLAKS